MVAASMLLSSCEKKPTACLDLPETLEAGTLLTLTSCSEDYEFLTWEFSDGIGVEGVQAQRTFEDEGSITIRLTAYADGAYKSDQVEEEYATSFRYLDRFEIIGNSPYDSLEIEFGNNVPVFKVYDADGSFTADDPLIRSFTPYTYTIKAEPTFINLFGRNFLGARVPLASDKFNFNVVKDNPTIIGSEEDNFYMKLYWVYRPI
jgi:hypothetical protein